MLFSPFTVYLDVSQVPDIHTQFINNRLHIYK